MQLILLAEGGWWWCGVHAQPPPSRPSPTMEPRTTSDPSKPAVAPPLRKSVDADELPLAWPALVDEVQALHRRGQLMAFQPQWMLAEVRRGAAKALPPPDQAIRLTVKAQSLFQKQKGLGELAAELHLLLPVGYPILPPLESCGGDVEVNMVGLASKRTMKALGRELHLHLLRVYEANCGALPRYVAEAIKWVEGRDVIDLVAAMAAPQHPKVRPALHSTSKGPPLHRVQSSSGSHCDWVALAATNILIQRPGRQPPRPWFGSREGTAPVKTFKCQKLTKNDLQQYTLDPARSCRCYVVVVACLGT